MKVSAQREPEILGYAYGLLGVCIFSLTLPATRLAVAGLDPVFVGLGRAIGAAGMGGMLPRLRSHFFKNSLFSYDILLNKRNSRFSSRR